MPAIPADSDSASIERLRHLAGMSRSLARPMAHALPALLTFMATLAAAPGCAARPSETRTARPGESFTLRVGESASVQGSSIVITFLEVVGDSRCPQGVQCVWEGDATVRISISRGPGSPEQQDLHTSSREPGGQSERGYVTRLVRLDPLPIAGGSIPPADYEATLQIDPE